MVYDKHIFVCTNERKNSTRLSCGEAHGLELITAFKEGIKQRNISLKIRSQKSGCLDICDFGPTVVVYPDAVFYVGVKLSDVDEIIDSHLLKNQVVTRLLLDPKFKK
jgi:(2Fe-2S) ferredoxin